jgi:hypothetical protein
VERPNWLIQGFREDVLDARLIDIELHGYPFTWFKSLGTDRAVEVKVDRALASVEWCNLFTHAKLECLTTTTSDHYPLLLSWEQWSLHYKPPSRFKFENSWLVELNFSPFVQQKWQAIAEPEITNKLTLCAKEITQWCKENVQRTRKDIERYRKKMEALRSQVNETNLQYYDEVRRKLDTLLVKDDLYWKQRAKTFRYLEGDLNTRFFHAAATTRRKVNQIEHLEDSNGIVCNTIEGMKVIAKDYFADLFQKQSGEREIVVNAVTTGISMEDNDMLTAPFTITDFKEATFSMEADKCPGPDGFNPGFYQHFWEICVRLLGYLLLNLQDSHNLEPFERNQNLRHNSTRSRF